MNRRPVCAECGDNTGTCECLHLHCRPVGDLLHHELSWACVCGPVIEQIRRSDGTYGYHIVHNALDGRE